MGFQSLWPRRGSDARAIADSIAQPERFADIFDRHFDAIYGYLARRVGPASADDLASTTFVIAFERRRAFRGEATSARPWLYGIALNLMREHWRSDARGEAMVSRLAAEAAATGAAESPTAPEAAGTAVDDALAAALAALDADQREVLLLVAWEELSYAEIAEALDIPVGTVRSRLARARQQLAARLEPGPPTFEEQETTR